MKCKLMMGSKKQWIQLNLLNNNVHYSIRITRAGFSGPYLKMEKKMRKPANINNKVDTQSKLIKLLMWGVAIFGILGLIFWVFA